MPPDIFDQVSGSTKGDIFDSFAPSPKKKGIFEQGIDLALQGAKYAGGAVVGAGEIAANLATQTYGLPARGYAEIANLATGRTDLPEKVSKALIYEPQTEQGKAGMDAIGGAFDWWHEKSIAAGTPVQEAVTKIAGETAGNVAGATVASTMEAAPLLLGEVLGKAKGKIAERRAARDQATIRDTLAKEKRIQSEADLSRAPLGDVIPEDPIVAAATREAATRQVSGDIFDRISRGYLGEEVQPKGIREDMGADPFVMGRDISPADQLEKYGSDVYDRIRRGYLGDTTVEAPPKPFVAPQVQEYAGMRPPPPKQLLPPAAPEAPQAGGKIIQEGIDRLIRSKKPVTIETSPVTAPEPPAPLLGAPITPEAIPTPPRALEAPVPPSAALGSPEFYKAEAAKLPGDVRYVGDMGGRPMFQDEGGAGSFTKAPAETIPEALARARARYETPSADLMNLPKSTEPEKLSTGIPQEIPQEETPGQKFANVRDIKSKQKTAAAEPNAYDERHNAQVSSLGTMISGFEPGHRVTAGYDPSLLRQDGEIRPGYGSTYPPWFKSVFPGDSAKAVATVVRRWEAGGKLSKRETRIMNSLHEMVKDSIDRGVDAATETPSAKVVSGNDIALGDSFRIEGEKFKAVKYDEQGRLVIKDGVEHRLKMGEDIPVDGGKEGITPGEIPKAAKGQQDLIKDKSFKLAEEPVPEGPAGEFKPSAAGEQPEIPGMEGQRAKYRATEKAPPAAPPGGGLFGNLEGERGSSPELARAAKQIKEFFVPLSTIPEGKAYMSLRYKDLLGGLTRVDRIVGQLSDRFKGLSISDKADVFNAIRGEIPMDTLPAETQMIARQTRADLNRTGQMLVKRGLLSKETFEANKDTYIHYLYLRHILPDGESIPVGRGGRLDLSYLKARKDLPELVRQELGLIEDVSVAAPVGMGKALGDIVKADFFKKVASNPDWVWQPSKEIAKLTSELKNYKQIVDRGENVGPEVMAKYKKLEADLAARSAEAGKAPADFVQLPDSPSYGEMKGAFVRKEIANDVVPIYSANIGDLEGLAKTWSKVGKGFDAGMTIFKTSKVALNPPTAIRNVFSNFIQMNMSGIPIYRVPDTVIGGVKSMIAKDKLFRTLERNGGFKTNFSVAELGEVLKTFEDAKKGPVSKFFSAVGSMAKYYGKIDDIAKMSLFKDAVTRQGMPVPDAVQYAQKWGMDYSLASRSVKHGRRYALPFLSYQYKIAPLIAESLAQRPWVLAKYIAIPYLMAKYAAEKYDWTDKDLDKAQQMMKEKTQGQGAYMLLPTKDNKGNIEMVNMEYFLPWGNWLEAARDLKGGNFIDTAKQFGGLLGPYGNVISMLNTKRQGEPPKDPFTGQAVYSKLDSPKDKYLKQTEWWWKLFGPSSFSSTGALGYTAKAIAGGKDKWGVEATGAKALGRWMGVNVGSLDSKSVMATRKFKIRELDSEIHKIYRDPKYSKEDRLNALRQLKIERKKILSPVAK